MILKKPGFGRLAKEIKMGTGQFGSAFQIVQRFFYLFLAIATIGCSQGVGGSTIEPIENQSGKLENETSAIVGKITLNLVGCTLNVSKTNAIKNHEVDLPGSCRFITNKDGHPQIVETRVGSTLLIASSSPLEGSKFCDTRVRAVTVHDKNIVISQGQQKIRTCSNGPYDTKMFHVLAESTESRANP